MTVEVVRINGRILTRFLPSDDTIEACEAHCTSQTCGTADGIVPSEIAYENLPEEGQYEQAQRARTKEWWESPAGEHERETRRNRKAKRDREIAEFDRGQKEKLDARKREWAKDAMRCGLPNPFPEAFK